MAAADNQFRLRITAQDQAGPIVQKLEARLGKFATRLALGKKVDDLSKSQLEQRVTQRFDGLAKKIQGIGSALGGTASSLSAPVSAIAGGAIIAGITASATSWASYGNSVLRTAQMTGIGTDELQKLRGAAKLAGVEAEQLDGGISALGTTLNDAANGRNMAALAMLNRLGISIHRTKDGAVDTSAALKDLAQVMASSKMSAQTKSMIAGQFGVQGLMPMLMDGRKKLEGDMAKTQAMGAVQTPAQLKEADQAKRHEREAGLGHQRANNWLGDYVGPLYGKLMEGAAKMLSEHPGATLAGGAAAGLGGSWVISKAMTSIGQRMIAAAAKGVATTVAADGTAAAAGSAVAGASLGSMAASLAGWVARFSAGVAGVAGAGAGGYWLGGKIYDKLIAGTSVGDKLGEWEAKLLAAFGNEEAQHALDVNAKHQITPRQKLAQAAKQELHQKAQSATAPIVAGQKLAQAVDPSLPQKAQSARLLPRGIRNNNPGNLQFVGQAGAAKEAGAAGRFAVFDTPEAGLDAMAKQLVRYGNSGLTSVQSIIRKWAPSSENNTAAYAAAVAKRMGVDVGQSLDMGRPEVIRSLMDAMIVRENGYNPYARQMLDASAAAGVNYKGGARAAAPSTAPAAAASGNASPSLAVTDPAQKALIDQLRSLQDAVAKLADAKIQIAVSGLPAGARATATGGPATVSSAAKYNYSMPEMIAP
ncbi:hypothetical protein [Chromobacterium violaceum]|uniref:hypothetical protein n=1 Tax=Chromobacterium violaceum TaxID=536 RepID=UPI001CE03DA9|nr:hypothetical protein [Chromobacterium violaceum]